MLFCRPNRSGFTCNPKRLGGPFYHDPHQRRGPAPLTHVDGGRIGYRLARLLEEHAINCKIIERNPDRCTYLAERLNKAIVLNKDGSDQELLAEENIQGMDVVNAPTQSEETNILASLLAKRMGACKTITRISKFNYFPLTNAIAKIVKILSVKLE